MKERNKKERKRMNRFKEIYKHAFNFPCLKVRSIKTTTTTKKICCLIIRKLAWLNYIKLDFRTRTFKDKGEHFIL